MKAKIKKALVIIILFACLIPFSNGIREIKLENQIGDDEYPPLSFDFNNFWADIVWMKAIQYLGTVVPRDGGILTPTTAGEFHRQMKQVTDLNPNFLIAYEFGCLLSTVSPDRALFFVRKGIERNPDHSWRLPYYGAVISYHELGDSKEASWFLEKAVAVSGHPPSVDIYLARAYVESDEIEKAYLVLRSVAKDVSVSPHDRKRATDELLEVAERVAKEGENIFLKIEAKNLVRANI